MIRRFCDRCGSEIEGRSNAAHNRLKVEDGRVKVEVYVAVDGTWNSGEVCAPCVAEVVLTSQEPVRETRQESLPAFQVYPDTRGTWRWRLKGEVGHVVAVGGVHLSSGAAAAECLAVKKAAEGATIEEVEP